MPRLLLLVLLVVAQAALAAPQQIKAVYQATRNGQPFATVTETYTRDGSKYRLESLTEGIGVYALFGKRRLASEGVAFDALVQRVQQEQASELLAGSTPIRDIAFALGFSDTTAFSRAFRRWTGKTPTEARAARAR